MSNYQEGKMNDTYGKPAGEDPKPKADLTQIDMEAASGVPMVCQNPRCEHEGQEIEVHPAKVRVGVQCDNCSMPLVQAAEPKADEIPERDQPIPAPEGDTVAETIAMAFHAAYEKLAPRFSYETRKASAVPWKDVPEDNRRLMTATVHELLRDDVIMAPAKRYPYGEGDAIVLGPEVFVSKDGRTINWRGDNYIPQGA